MSCLGCKERARLLQEAIADLRAGNYRSYVDNMYALAQTITVDINQIVAKLKLPPLDQPNR